MAELVDILAATRPVNVYTHNLADKHSTHLAAVVATIEAIRLLPADQRPWRVVGIEGWRSLDWLSDDEKVLLDISGHRDLARRLAAVFASQIDGGKRYDLAEEGRRRANATLLEPRAVDDVEELSLAMDLTPLVHNADLDPVALRRRGHRPLQGRGHRGPGALLPLRTRRSRSSDGRPDTRAPSRGC